MQASRTEARSLDLPSQLRAPAVGHPTPALQVRLDPPDSQSHTATKPGSLPAPISPADTSLSTWARTSSSRPRPRADFEVSANDPSPKAPRSPHLRRPPLVPSFRTCPPLCCAAAATRAAVRTARQHGHAHLPARRVGHPSCCCCLLPVADSFAPAAMDAYDASCQRLDAPRPSRATTPLAADSNATARGRLGWSGEPARKQLRRGRCGRRPRLATCCRPADLDRKVVTSGAR